MSDIIKGSTLPISSLTVSDSAGSQIDLTSLDNVIVYIVSKSGAVIAKVSMAIKSGYITATQVSNYILSFKVPGSYTLKAETGPLRVQVYQEDTDGTVPVDGKTRYMGSGYLKDTDGTVIHLVDEPINAEAV